MKKVITIGSAVKDVFLIPQGVKLLKSKQFETGVGECFAYGAKVEVGEVYFDTGGGATNAAATLRNFNIPVAIYSKVGLDSSGKEIYEDLRKRKVDTTNLRWHKKLGTAYSTILLSPKGDRTILVYRGASQDFSPADIMPSRFKDDWFYLTAAGGNLAFVKKVFAVAKLNNVQVFWNPGGGEVVAGLKALTPYLKMTTVLSLNKEEAEKLTGSKNLKENLKLLGSLCSVVLVTDGKVGAYINAGGASFFAKSLGTKAVNATGAGDAFGSAFLAGLILRNDLDYALRLAMLNSDGVIQEMGAKHGLLKKLPSKGQLDRVKLSSL